MKNRLTIFLAVLALVFVYAFAGHAEEPIKLRYAEQNPESAWSADHCVKPWIKNVEEATDGRVEIEAYHDQTLAKGKDMWNAVQAGITDIGWCFHGYWPDLTPLADVISLPGLPFKTAEKGSEVLWKLYQKFPQIQKEFEDVKILLFYTSAPYHLIMRDEPVKNLKDLQGKKLRMTGGPPTQMARELGASATLIPMPDVYMALQQGTVDGMAGPWEAVEGFRFYEVADYYTENTPFPAVYFSIAMNKKKWNSLPKDIQDDIMSVCGLEGSRFWGKNFHDDVKNAALKALKEDSGKDEVFKLSEKERQRWIEKGAKPVQKKWVERMGRKGYDNVQEILDEAIRLSK